MQIVEKHKKNVILTWLFLLCLFFTATAVHRTHTCSICTEDVTDCSVTHEEEKHCASGTTYTWPKILIQGINKASLRHGRGVPSWLPGPGRYDVVLSSAITKQCPIFSSQISAILYPVPDVLSQLPSPTWFMFIILSIKKLVIKMKHPLPILLPAFTLLHLPIPSTLLVFKRLISMWSCLCQDSPVPSAPFLDDQSHPDLCLPCSKIQHIF